MRGEPVALSPNLVADVANYHVDRNSDDFNACQFIVEVGRQNTGYQYFGHTREKSC